MKSFGNEASPTESIQSLPAAASALRIPRTRQTVSAIDNPLMSESEASLPFRRSNPSAASLFASTLTPPGSRPLSPVGRGSPSRILSGSVFERGASRSLKEGVADNPGDPLNLLTKAYVPFVAVYASEDTDELARAKGFRDGLWELLRPFGERVQGKVTVRDSNGASRVFEDFSIRFVKFGENVEQPEPTLASLKSAQAAGPSNVGTTNISRGRRTLQEVEELVGRHLDFAEESFASLAHHRTLTRQGLDVEATSPYYALYLRRLLGGVSLAPHETFAHPVACVITISSRNQSPLEELRRLYSDTNQGGRRLPAWVQGDYLRYYVLVHDEETDDIAKSMSLFEQMKRHFGLHCHLLRLRSSQSAETDDDSIPLPRSEWMSASEELAAIQRSDEAEEFEATTTYIFESDATAIRTFVREMVAQSIVPTMERHVGVWNDQVASRRRGITGRLMSLSRRWGVGSGSSRSASGPGSISTSPSNFDSGGFYKADMPEAIMRRLADFAFMLRDWKLAQSTYDLLRSDFSDAKAWKYHAAANEMAAVSLLVAPQGFSSKTRSETIDQMLEAAFYSYNTRCSHPYGALRTLVLGVELLRLRGGSSIDDAVRWGIRLLESKIAGSIGDALVKERLAICYASKDGVGSSSWGSRKRKSAIWSVLGAEAWLELGKHIQAQRCLNEATRTYEALPSGNGVSKFAAASEFMAGMQSFLAQQMDGEQDGDEDGGAAGGESDDGVDEESEALGGGHERRPSMVGRIAQTGSLETAPLHEMGGEEKPALVDTKGAAAFASEATGDGTKDL